MKISLRTLPVEGQPFNQEFEDVTFSGTVRKKRDLIAFLSAEIVGKVLLTCDRCAEEFEEAINEKQEMLISDGIFNGSDESYDIIEAENGLIDFELILQSELNLFRGDYHYCAACADKN